MSDTSTLIAIKYKGQMIDIPSGGSADTSNFVTKTELFDEKTTTTEPDYTKGNTMYVGKDGSDSSYLVLQFDWTSTYKACILFNNLTEQDNIWNYSYFGDYCYMEIINTNNNNDVYGWFILYKDGSVVMTSENLSSNQIILEYITSGWPSGLMIIIDDSNITNANYNNYTVYFYTCIYTPGESSTTYTIKESLLPESSGGGVSIQYLTQAQYDALQSKDPNTLYLIEATV